MFIDIYESIECFRNQTKLVIMPILASVTLLREKDSVERIVLDFESEVMRGPGSIPTGGLHFSLDFFYFCVVKPLLPILALLPFLCISKKLY